MPAARRLCAAVIMVCLLVPLGVDSSAQDTAGSPWEAAPPPIESSDGPRMEIERAPGEITSVEAAVIHPFRSSNVGAEVGGIIEEFHYDEGDRVENDDVVVVISRDRYALQVKKAQEELHGLELALKRAETDLNIKTDLLALDAATRQQVLRARAEAEIARGKMLKAANELELALLNLKACTVRAPFAGYLAVRYKQPHEPVKKLEKIFAIVDSAQVYAVANVPEQLVPLFRIGAQAVFVHSSGQRFEGIVERIGKLIDSKSVTKRVYVLIRNSEGRLEIGATGSVEIKNGGVQ